MANSGVYSLGIRCAGDDQMRYVYGPAEAIKEQYQEVKDALENPGQTWIEIQGWAETPDRVDATVLVKREEVIAVRLGEY